MIKPRILVVDDESRAVAGLISLLQLDGYHAEGLSDPLAALQRLGQGGVDILLTDLKMPGMSGMELLAEAKKVDPHLSVVMITGQGGVADAVTAMKQGAEDYLAKPVNIEELEIILARIWERVSLIRQNQSLRASLTNTPAMDGFIGTAPQMGKIFHTIQEVAPTSATVLIEGETGTGKELVARSLHALSLRAGKPLIAVNCAALTESLLESELFGHVRGAFTGAVRDKRGKFSLADGGTLFLDEIGEMSLATQAKLLRVLVSGEYQLVGGEKTDFADVRIIAATNKRLRQEVEQGRFREDLYYRLNVIEIMLPPLRDRLEDIPLLVKHFIDQSAAREQVPPRYPDRQVYDVLQGYDWPGNVRELENVIERALIYAKEHPIQPGDLSFQGLANSRLSTPAMVAADPVAWQGLTLKEMEKKMILLALERLGSKKQAAKALGISVRKIEYKLREWDNGKKN
ncbi:MAG: sigma-54-dependent Fis family transcriptional regulator [Deltaproteobacteria bacterium]|nr:sigma-54-dependent Fis family transcriptional regulator [Candidatus Anaeroferrophillus wilburensis]